MKLRFLKAATIGRYSYGVDEEIDADDPANPIDQERVGKLLKNGTVQDAAVPKKTKK